MERHIPHVLDVFTTSPGARRRMRAALDTQEKDDLQKNPGSDSAVSVGSSDDESDEQKSIAKYFDYLNEDDMSSGGSSQRRKKKKKPAPAGRESSVKEGSNKVSDQTSGSVLNKNEKNKQVSGKIERSSRKGEYEKDMRYIERHLSMKKTIRKKIMRDLQQAFMEDPKDLQQDPKSLTKEKKNYINFNNLTFSKGRLSKSEHNFLDMLKDDAPKDKKGLRALIDFRKEKPTSSSPEQQDKVDDKQAGKSVGNETKSSDDKKLPAAAQATVPDDTIRDDDSGHGSPTREASTALTKRSRSKDDLLDVASDNKDKKQSFWKRITGKGKARR